MGDGDIGWFVGQREDVDRAKAFFLLNADEFLSDQFEQSELHQNAVIRPLEIIGEAAGLISQQTRNEHHEIPWKQMIGMRNRLIHEYSSVNYETVWDTIKNDLPTLIVLIEPLVPPEDES